MKLNRLIYLILVLFLVSTTVSARYDTLAFYPFNILGNYSAPTINTSGFMFINGTNSNIDYLQFNTTITHASGLPGQVHWNNQDGTLDYNSEFSGVDIQIGQENVVKVVNKANTNLVDGQAVFISGAQGNRPKVDLASNLQENTSDKLIGLVTMPIANNAEGLVTSFGLVRDLKTNQWAVGDILYLDSVAGNLTNVEPTAPLHLIKVGIVLSSHINQGIIFVDPDLGYELNELHNVKLLNTTTGDLLAYNSTSALWYNKNSSLFCMADGTNCQSFPSLTGYAKLDGSNQPFTGNININKTNPEIRLISNDTNSSFTIFNRSSLNELQLVNNVLFKGTNTSGVVFNGVSTRIALPKPAITAVPITFSFWEKSVNANSNGLYDTAPSAGNVLRAFNGNFEWFNQDPSVSSAVTANTWNHFVITYTTDGTNRRIKWWKNGVNQTDVTSATSPAFAWSPTWYLGNINNGAPYYNGTLQEFLVFNRTLNLSDVSILYNAGAGTYGNISQFPWNDSLKAGYHFNGDLNDFSGNGLTGSGAVTYANGLITLGDTPYVATVLKSNNGISAAEGQVLQIGDTRGRTVLEGQTIRFNTGGVEQFQIDSSGDLVMPDNQKTFFGDAKDASIYYNGSNIIINPRDVGTGNLIISSANVGVATGNPTVPLDVNGTIKTNSKLTVGATDITGTTFIIGSAVNSYSFQNYLTRSTSAPVWVFTAYDNTSQLTGGNGTTQKYVSISPIYNQTGTASSTDLLINRTEISVGSGAQYLINAGTNVGGNFISLFNLNNKGEITINKTVEGQPLLLQNNATYYLDAKIDGNAMAPGVFSPVLTDWNNTLAQLWCFAGTVRNEYSSGTTELPHSWKEGSMISPHIHVSKSTATAGNYTFNLNGYVKNATGSATITFNENITITTGGQWDEGIFDFTDITPTGFITGSTFNFRLTRLQDNPLDNYPDCVGLKQVSIHFESDTLGSASEYGKWS